MERILVIRKRQPARIMQKSNVLNEFNLTEEKLNYLIETGNALMVDEKQICFDIPMKEAYE